MGSVLLDLVSQILTQVSTDPLSTTVLSSLNLTQFTNPVIVI